MLWGMTINLDHVIEARSPDIVVVEKESNKEIIVDMASPWDRIVYEEEGERTEKYQEPKREIGSINNTNNNNKINKSNSNNNNDIYNNDNNNN